MRCEPLIAAPPEVVRAVARHTKVTPRLRTHPSRRDRDATGASLEVAQDGDV